MKRKDFESILKYFGYDLNSFTDNGDDRKYNHPGYKGKGIYYTVTQKTEMNKNAIATLRFALMHINETNGELMIQSGINHGMPTEEELADFIEKTKEYDSNKNKNRYRRHFEKQRKKYKNKKR